MKTFKIFMGTCILLLLKDISNTQAATLKCSDGKQIVDLADHKSDADNNSTEQEEFDVHSNYKEGNKTSLNKLFQNIQCTLEKAKPWVAELQQEAKRLQEAAKLLGLGLLNSFGDFVDKLVEETAETTASTQSFTTNNADKAANSTEIVDGEISQYLCPEGFVADYNGLCELVQ